MKQVKIFLVLLMFATQANAQLFNDDTYKFSKVIGLIDKFYVDSVDRSLLVEDAIRNMLLDLDPHSVYMTAEETNRANEEMSGNFEGIGIQFNIMNDTLLVVSPIMGGPSEKLGILSGDRIITIDEEVVAGIGLTNQMVFDRLRGDKGTKVVLEIKRGNEEELLAFEVVRDKIPIYSLDAAYMVDRATAYVKLNRFSATTMKEYNEALNTLKKEGAENLILDLTNNGGGYLNMAFDLADEFLDDGQMVVYTEGIQSPRQDFVARKSGALNYKKVVIMIDQGSASASEIVSGAVQDWDRGVLVGRRSFGKGLVQRPFSLPDGSMMRLTVARYYTPTGRLIQKSYEEGSKEYHAELIERYNSGELQEEDSIQFPDSLKYNTLVNKRTVYGGGGVMPDFFVPIDTLGYSDYYRDLIRKGIINRYLITYMDNNRKGLERKYQVKEGSKGFESFKTKFQIDEEFLQGLIEFAEKDDLPFNEAEFETSKEKLSVQLKALVARSLWNTSEFFEIINEIDPIYNQAIEVIKSDELYNSKLKN